MFHKILVCLDGSKLAESVLPYSIFQAQNFGSKLVLLNVCMRNAYVLLPSSGEVSFTSIDLILREFALRWQESTEYLKELIKTIEKKRIPLESAVVEGTGTVAETIVEYAENHAVDLIAMASRGYRGWKKLILGSIAGSVIQNTSIPVFMIKSGGKDTHSSYDLASYEPTRDFAL